MEYRFGYYINHYLKPLYYLIPYDVNNVKNTMLSNDWKDMTVEQISKVISLKGQSNGLINIIKEDNVNKELSFFTNNDDMMDLRIRIRNKNTIEWTDIYTEMPIMRESYKLKETPTPAKGVFYEDKNKNETIIGGSDTIEMSLNQENIIKVHINDLDSKKIHIRFMEIFIIFN